MKKIFLSIIGFVLIIALFIYVILPVGIKINQKSNSATSAAKNATDKFQQVLSQP